MRLKKIFIVDDDVMLTEALSDYLTRDVPHQVSVFSTGEECLKQLYENPDVIILDYYLNTVQKDAANGMEILQAIRKSRSKANVIMLSSQERYSIAAQTLQKGAEQYVIKDKDSFANILELLQKM
jgi:DNA-binding NarL/FixJ family response regulator